MLKNKYLQGWFFIYNTDGFWLAAKDPNKLKFNPNDYSVLKGLDFFVLTQIIINNKGNPKPDKRITITNNNY